MNQNRIHIRKMASKMSLLPFLFVLFFLVKCNARTSSAFEFIKGLQGHEKGSKAQGLHDLKLYLARFGYLNYHPTPTPNHASPQDHHFDQDLENALKSYQNFHNLNPTGTLDEATVSQMAKPRCGHPDIKPDHQHNPNPLHFKSHYEVTPCLYRWPAGKTNLSYAFDSTFPTEYIRPVIRAFSTWDSASDYFTFHRVDDFEGSDMKIKMVTGEGTPFNGPGTLAVGGSPPDGGLLYNSVVNWTAGPETVPDAFDVETVGLHEIGHLLGFGHSQFGNSIMWPTIGPTYIKGLSSDDIEGLKFMYENTTPCVDPVPPPAP